MTDAEILERLDEPGLRPVANRLRGAWVVKRKSDFRPVTTQQWWLGALSREQMERIALDVDFRQDYLAREWTRGIDVASTRDPPPPPEPPADLKDHWSDDETRWDAPKDAPPGG